jgi:hypothetical protein
MSVHDLPDEKTLIQAVLDRRVGLAFELRQVVEGALAAIDCLPDRFPFHEHGVERIDPEELSIRVRQLGENRMQEVFVVLAPGLEDWILLAWKRMKNEPQRFTGGFCYPRVALRRAIYEAWWLSDMFKLMTRFPVSPFDLAKLAGSAEIVGNAVNSAAGDYLIGALTNEKIEADRIVDALITHLKSGIPSSITWLVVTTLIRMPCRRCWEELVAVVLKKTPDDVVISRILLNAYDGSNEAFCILAGAVMRNRLLRSQRILMEVNGWMGLRWKSYQCRQVKASLRLLCDCLSSSELRRDLIANGSAESMHIALLVEARNDSELAASHASEILAGDVVLERRFAAVHALARFRCNASDKALLEAMTDSDLRVAYHAAEGILNGMDGFYEGLDKDKLRQHCDTLLERLPTKPKALPPLVWPWCRIKPFSYEVEMLKPLMPDSNQTVSS